MADTTETADRRTVEYLSSECVRLGRINQHNGDDAEFFLISKEICVSGDQKLHVNGQGEIVGSAVPSSSPH